MTKRPILSDYDGTYDQFNILHGVVDAIVTGKGYDEFGVVDEAHKVDRPIFFNPMRKDDIDKGYPLTVVRHKSDIINKTGARVFFENEKVEVSLLKLFCPNCTIVLVGSGEDLSKYL